MFYFSFVVLIVFVYCMYVYACDVLKMLPSIVITKNTYRVVSLLDFDSGQSKDLSGNLRLITTKNETKKHTTWFITNRHISS